MKTSHFIYILIAMIMFASCGQTAHQENIADTNHKMSNTPMFAQTSNSFPSNFKPAASATQNTPNQQTPIQSEKKPVRLRDDATGMVMVTFPVPISWNPAQGQPDVQLEGPGGIKIYKEMTNTFYFSSDDATNNIMKEQGYLVKAPLTHDDLLTKEFQPLAEQSGSTLTNSYALRAIADTESRIDAMYIKTIPETTIFHATVTEWEDKNGTPSLIVIKYKKTDYGQGFVSWGYTISDMTANKSAYPQAKIDFLDALIQKEANPEYVAYVNQKATQSDSSYNDSISNPSVEPTKEELEAKKNSWN